MRSRNGYTGFSVGVNSQPAPSALGVQSFIMIPLGTYRKARRRAGLAPDLFKAVRAGAIASRNGNATAVPNPRRNARRGRDFFVMIMARGPSSSGMVRY